MVADRVEAARDAPSAASGNLVAAELGDTGQRAESGASPRLPGPWCRSTDTMKLVEISARGLDRVLRVAWTLADLADKQRPGPLRSETCSALGLWLGVSG